MLKRHLLTPLALTVVLAGGFAPDAMAAAQRTFVASFGAYRQYRIQLLDRQPVPRVFRSDQRHTARAARSSSSIRRATGR